MHFVYHRIPAHSRFRRRRARRLYQFETWVVVNWRGASCAPPFSLRQPMATKREAASGTSLKAHAVQSLMDFVLDQSEGLERAVGIPEIYALAIEDEILGEVRMRLACHIARLRLGLPCRAP